MPTSIIKPGDTLAALTLWQPWASLLAKGVKRYETRSWPAPASLYPGCLVAIHAAARRVNLNDDFSEAFLRAWCAAFNYPPPVSLIGLTMEPRGCVLGVSRFLRCHRTEDVDASEAERLFGDFTPGRYAWEFAPVEVFEAPIPARGMQGVWKWTVPE